MSDFIQHFWWLSHGMQFAVLMIAAAGVYLIVRGAMVTVTGIRMIRTALRERRR